MDLFRGVTKMICRLMRLRNFGDSRHKIRFLGDLQRLSTQPGDVFAITSDKKLDAEQRRHIMVIWEHFMPGHEVIVLDGGLKVGAVGNAVGSPNTEVRGR